MNIGSLEETFQIACSNGQPEIVENLLQIKTLTSQHILILLFNRRVFTDVFQLSRFF